MLLRNPTNAKSNAWKTANFILGRARLPAANDIANMLGSLGALNCCTCPLSFVFANGNGFLLLELQRLPSNGKDSRVVVLPPVVIHDWWQYNLFRPTTENDTKNQSAKKHNRIVFCHPLFT